MYIPRTAKRRRTTVLFLLPSLIGHHGVLPAAHWCIHLFQRHGL